MVISTFRNIPHNSVWVHNIFDISSRGDALYVYESCAKTILMDFSVTRPLSDFADRYCLQLTAVLAQMHPVFSASAILAEAGIQF